MPIIRPLDPDNFHDLEALFGGDRAAGSCWCMWFIIRVKDYHQGGAAANEAKFKALAASSAHPLGLVAYSDGAPVGWTAAGPRSRYVRAVNTPTLKAVDRAEDETVWLVPCFFIRRDFRAQGIARLLLEGAVELAWEAGAAAIEGFPTAGAKRGSADQQVGTEKLFESCGFAVLSRPSSNRVLMRRQLSG